MENKITEEELREMESQLSFPDGEKGIEMANAMNDNNRIMISETIKALNLKNNQVILEIGHGNGRHLTEILNQAEKIRFVGLEISPTMQQEAEQINKDFVTRSVAEFKLYDGKTIPSPDNSFDRVMTVNSIYFWTHPVELLSDIYRVVKPNGVVAVTFAQKQFMQQLPFIKDKFRLYNNQDLQDLIAKTYFNLTDILDKADNVTTKTGEQFNRNFSIALLKKELQ